MPTHLCCSAVSMLYRPSLSISGNVSGGAAVLMCNGPAAVHVGTGDRLFRYCSLLLMPRLVCEDTGRTRLLLVAVALDGGTTNADTPNAGPSIIPPIPEVDGSPEEEEEPPLLLVVVPE